ncbi:CDP-diacylglycerol--serine O-phosphatidyltransferase [Aliirhizobium smilacinae]|uniref:CDP-diacylglycerol--serine O-phosphatidyltransferase n=1 Tax=Aliirhizobium smilacinae TaxID=1395944 RepID=A0A5C4XBV7_9HYPH|nr:CDP-diacylglycerol--serine O-phosphatidyltransferase [Rhizobium smilacinae]TNM59894.1 CDP-diacylglycerol--serine O-phosphatidyltransferase [Rhizobium smilacinae]
MVSPNLIPPSESATSDRPPSNAGETTGRIVPSVFGVPAIAIPTLVTSASALCGLIAINCAMAERFEQAVLFVLTAAAFDAIDGQAARRFNCASQFGVELDSLVDFLSFGIAPGIIVYIWGLETSPTIGFPIIAFYVLCCAYRLARFNAAALTKLEAKSDPGFFQGVPAPAGAMCALLPLMWTFSSGSTWSQSWLGTAFVMITTSFLMVSTVPTISSKMIAARLSSAKILAGTLLLGGCFLLFPYWSVLTFAVLGYVASVPISLILMRTSRRRDSLKHPGT